MFSNDTKREMMLDIMVAAVKRYAMAHYEESAWDTIVECYSDAEIRAEIIDCASERDAIETVRWGVDLYHGYSEDIRHA